jgi:hypothetical protein
VSAKETVGDAAADTVLRWSLEDDCGEVLDGWIYMIGCLEPLSFKIGFTTKDPRHRLKQLQTGNPTPLKLIGWFPGNQRQERHLHGQLNEFRMSGEWFRLDERAGEILREPLHWIFINNALTGHEKTLPTPQELGL